MNSRLRDFENLITRPDGSIDDIFSERQRETNEFEQIMSMTPQQAYQLSTSIQAQFATLKTELEPMRTKFIEACSEALKEKPIAGRQAIYKNVLPYGTDQSDPNPRRQNMTQDINENLENLDPSLTNQLHQLYIRIFRKMFPDSYNELSEEMFENYGNKSASKSEVEIQLNQILSSAIGSMFDWPSIDPKSVGLGSIEHIADLFQKYYMGEIDEKNPHQEKPTSGRKYAGNNILEIQADKFYNDFINGFFLKHCVQEYVSKDKTGPSDFKKDIEGFYDFNPELWFENKTNTGDKFKYSDASKDFDSYGHFFKVKQPIKWEHAAQVQVVPANDPRDKSRYTGIAIGSWDAAVQAAQAKKNNLTGFYNTYAADAHANQTFIITNEDKELCCLFHKAAIKTKTFQAAAAIANRAFTPNPPVIPLKPLFENANPANGVYGDGTDRGLDVGSGLGGANADINIVAQLLYNSQSIGFHVTHAQIAHANDVTLLAAGGIPNIQTVTAYTCGVRQGGGHYVDNGNDNPCQISNGAGGGAAAATAAGRCPLIFCDLANVTMTTAEIVTSFSKNSFQTVELKTLLKGGKPKHIKSLKAKSGIKKTLKIKHRKYKQIKQKGGGPAYVPADTTAVLFDIRNAEPTIPITTSPSLDASRLDFKITKKIFENYRKAIKEYVKRFRNNDPTAKIQTSILDKLANINHLGIFYHGPTDILNFGGNIGGHEPDDNIEFKELGEIFLFCSVISNTIKLMIHFFKNIKSCISYFVKSELEVIKTQINKSLKTVNSTTISSFNSSYFEKYTDGCNNLINNINKLVDFLENNTMRLGKPIGHGNAGQCLTDNQQIAMNLFFGANICHQSGNRGANPHDATPNTTYPIEYYTFHHYLIDFFSINSTQHFSKINTMKFERALRVLSSGNIVLNNGFVVGPAAADAYPKKEYSITNVSLGGIPFTFIKDKLTNYSWMTFGFLLNLREKSNEQLEDERILEINQMLSQITSQEKSDIKKKVIDTYKDIRLILVDPKIDLGSKNKILQKVFYAFFDDSNKVAKMIIEDHSEMEKKSKSVNIRKKTTITNIVQKRSISAGESSRLLFPKEIDIQKEMRKYSYKVDCLVNLLHTILISGPHGSMKNYNIFMYSISRLRNFVYRLYYLNKSFYVEKEDLKKKLLTESGFDLSKNKNKEQNKKITEELFKKMISVQLVDQNSHTQEWWKVMQTTFRNRTSIIHGKYFRLFAFVLMDNEIFLVDIFAMATSEHSIKSYSEILKKDIITYKDHQGHDIYHPDDNMLIKLPDFSKDTFYKKLLKGELYYEYLKDGTKNKKKLLEPLFIQGSTKEQLDHIVHDNRVVPAAGGRPARFHRSTKPETSFQVYRIEKQNVLHASSFRSWAYNLLFSMPTRIDVDDSHFKLHIQKSINNISPLGISQLIPSLEEISKINSHSPVVNFKSKVGVNNNSKLLLGNNINNKRIESQAKYISREQLILLGLVFGDSLN